MFVLPQSVRNESRCPGAGYVALISQTQNSSQRINSNVGINSAHDKNVAPSQ